MLIISEKRIYKNYIKGFIKPSLANADSSKFLESVAVGTNYSKSMKTFARISMRSTTNRQSKSLESIKQLPTTSPPTSPSPTIKSLPVIIRPSGYMESYESARVGSGKYVCQFIRGVKNYSNAELIVFNHLEIKSYGTPPPREPHQLSAFYLKEPQTALRSVNLTEWNEFFNYSATFRLESEGSFHIFRARLEKLKAKGIKHFSNKRKKYPARALWFVSHCTTSNSTSGIQSAREEYVLNLSKYIQIDVFTSNRKNTCSNRFKGMLNISQNTQEPDMGYYGFYLAFENHLCRDYITEKFWRVLESNGTTIPIALGGLSVADYEAIAPPNSFLHVKNFTSPQALAQHMIYVAQNDGAFHYYHQWRNEYNLVNKHVTNKISYLYHGGESNLATYHNFHAMRYDTLLL